jgi:hypothetical protein
VRSEWDLPRLNAWTKYCQSHPPLQKLVAAYLGFKAPVDVKPTEADNEAAAAFLMSLPELAHR